MYLLDKVAPRTGIVEIVTCATPNPKLACIYNELAATGSVVLGNIV